MCVSIESDLTRQISKLMIVHAGFFQAFSMPKVLFYKVCKKVRKEREDRDYSQASKKTVFCVLDSGDSIVNLREAGIS